MSLSATYQTVKKPFGARWPQPRRLPTAASDMCGGGGKALRRKAFLAGTTARAVGTGCSCILEKVPQGTFSTSCDVAFSDILRLRAAAVQGLRPVRSGKRSSGAFAGRNGHPLADAPRLSKNHSGLGGRSPEGFPCRNNRPCRRHRLFLNPRKSTARYFFDKLRASACGCPGVKTGVHAAGFDGLYCVS